MGTDVSDVGIRVDHACQKEVQDASSVFEDELEDETWPVGDRRGLHRSHGGFYARSSRVDEDGNLPAIELLEDRIELFVSNVSPIVVREHHNAVRVKLVESIFQLCETSRDVRKGQSSPEAKFVPILPCQLGDILIAVSSHFPCHVGNKMRSW